MAQPNPSGSSHLAASETYRCNSCGNRTRFDVYESRRARQFQHFDLGGSFVIEEEEVLEREVEKIVCRWCGSADHIEKISAARPAI